MVRFFPKVRETAEICRETCAVYSGCALEFVEKFFGHEPLYALNDLRKGKPLFLIMQREKEVDAQIFHRRKILSVPVFVQDGRNDLRFLKAQIAEPVKIFPYRFF